MGKITRESEKKINMVKLELENLSNVQSENLRTLTNVISKLESRDENELEKMIIKSCLELENLRDIHEIILKKLNNVVLKLQSMIKEW
ncbi:MAG: hypothetical protein ACTSR2_00115 [Candidatus Hodarchaeales archaeon]